MSELMLDPRQEILDIIDTDSHKYKHCQPYVKWSQEDGKLSSCCVNGLVMMHLGWKPNKNEWLYGGGGLPESWQKYAVVFRDRYGEDTLGDINTINAGCSSWEECKEELSKFWGFK